MKGRCPDWGKAVGTFSIFSNYTACTAKSHSQGWYLNTGNKSETEHRHTGLDSLTNSRPFPVIPQILLTCPSFSSAPWSPPINNLCLSFCTQRYPHSFPRSSRWMHALLCKSVAYAHVQLQVHTYRPLIQHRFRFWQCVINSVFSALSHSQHPKNSWRTLACGPASLTVNKLSPPSHRQSALKPTVPQPLTVLSPTTPQLNCKWFWFVLPQDNKS